MLSLFSAILALMMQGPLGVDVIASAEGASSQRLLASLQRISSDPMLSRMIAELFEEAPKPVHSSPAPKLEVAVPPVVIPEAPVLRVARNEFSQAVRVRAGPVVR